MFDLSKSISQLYLAINGEKIDFPPSISTLKRFENAKKSLKKKQLFLACKIKLYFFYEGIKFLKMYFAIFSG